MLSSSIMLDMVTFLVSILSLCQSAALPPSLGLLTSTGDQVLTDLSASIRDLFSPHAAVKVLGTNQQMVPSQDIINKRLVANLPQHSDAFTPLVINVAETNTQVIMMEEIDPHRTNYMPKEDFQRQMNRYIAGIEYGIRSEGAEATWEFDEDDAHFGVFVLSIVSGQAGRRPTYGDLRSAGIVLRDNIEHFSVSSRSYQEVQLHVVRIGTNRDLPLAVIDVFRGNSVSLELFNGTLPGGQQACQSAGCLNRVDTTK